MANQDSGAGDEGKTSVSEPASQAVDPQHATNFQISADASDITFIFSKRVFPFSPQGISTDSAVSPIAAISLSPIMVKDLHKVLGGVLAEFEERFGPIPDIPAKDES